MVTFSIPPTENRAKQALAAVVVTVIVVIVLLILGRLAVAGIIALLGVTYGIGAEATGNNPFRTSNASTSLKSKPDNSKPSKTDPR